MISRNRIAANTGGSLCSRVTCSVANRFPCGGYPAKSDICNDEGDIKLQHLRQRPARRKTRIALEDRPQRWHQIDRLDHAIHRDVLAYARPHGHHPRRTRKRIARAVMLKPIPARGGIGIPAEVWQDKHARLALVLRIALY